MSAHNICFYKEVDKSILALTTKKLLHCSLIRVYAVIRLTTVCISVSQLLISFSFQSNIFTVNPR